MDKNLEFLKFEAMDRTLMLCEHLTAAFMEATHGGLDEQQKATVKLVEEKLWELYQDLGKDLNMIQDSE